MKAFLNNTATGRLVRKTVRWLLLTTVVVFVITGFGITEFRIVESLTSGLLTKNLAFGIHASPGLWLTLIVLSILHIGFSYVARVKKNGSGLVDSR
jgi:cytochrome b subunit of formate dehydrogenase